MQSKTHHRISRPMELVSWYNEDGRQWEFFWSNEEAWAEWINPYLSIYRAFSDNRIVGYVVGV